MTDILKGTNKEVVDGPSEKMIPLSYVLELLDHKNFVKPEKEDAELLDKIVTKSMISTLKILRKNVVSRFGEK